MVGEDAGAWGGVIGPEHKVRRVTAEAALDAARAGLPDALIVDGAATSVIAGVRQLEGGPAVAILAHASHVAVRAALREAGADLVVAQISDAALLREALDALLRRGVRERALQAHSRELAELATFNEDLTALLVHDLKNPLAVVAANLRYVSDVIAEATGLGEGAAELLDAVQDSRSATARLVLMLGVVLDVARAEAGHLALAPLRGELVGMLRRRLDDRARAARERRITLAVAAESPPELWYEYDQEVLGRVIDQLLEGSLRYTPAGGRIEVGCMAVASGVELWVSNNGPEVPEHMRRSIFEKYAHLGSRSENRLLNLGVGLYFCRLAVEAHRGRILCDSRENWPTSFRIELTGHAPGPPER